MPAVSKAQRRFMGMMEHNPEMAKAEGIDMTTEQMHDLASTKEKGLPKHVKPKKGSYAKYMEARNKGPK